MKFKKAFISYICIVCNRLYGRSVKHFIEEKYAVIEEDFFVTLIGETFSR